MRDEIVGDSRLPLFLLFAATCALLLVAYANLASLVLARGLSRQRELSLRTALGASRGRLLRQLTTECLLMVVIAGALGVGLAIAATRFLSTLGAEYVPRSAGIHVDAGVVLFALVVVASTVGVLGAISTFTISTVRLSSPMKGGWGSARRARGGVHRSDAFIVGQVAVALLLVTGGTLLARSLQQALKVDLDYQPAIVLSMTLSLRSGRYATPIQRIVFSASSRGGCVPFRRSSLSASSATCRSRMACSARGC